ncbi:MAG: nitrilase-related carbon-nitrogen hydrolase [Colwellia sp.]
MEKRMRVAVAQFATSFDIEENLTTCLRIIEEAATCKPQLIILPEYCNTLPNPKNHQHAWDCALSLDSEFLQKVAQQASKHQCSILINVTLRADEDRTGKATSVKSHISIASCLFGPCGNLIYQRNKQKLSPEEALFFTENESATLTRDNFEMDLGCLGVLSGVEESNFEISRSLSLKGAHLLCQSTGALFLDQTELTQINRAIENNVFFACASKIKQATAKQEKLESFEDQNSLTQEVLCSSALVLGSSQIISPKGEVLARVAYHKEGYAFADINLNESGLDKAQRPDGTYLVKQHRPELYYANAVELITGDDQKEKISSINVDNVALMANVAIFATYKDLSYAIEDVCHYIENNLSDIIQLPELFFLNDKGALNFDAERKAVEALSKVFITQVSAVLRPFQYLCTSLILDGNHQAVLIGEEGIVATQPQLHFCNRYQWTALGDRLSTITIPLEQGDIKLAMLTADDGNIPEMISVIAKSNAQLLLIPLDIQSPNEVSYHLLSRSVENRICIAAASREKAFSVEKEPSLLNQSYFTIDRLLKNGQPSLKSYIVKQEAKKEVKSTGLIINLAFDMASCKYAKPQVNTQQEVYSHSLLKWITPQIAGFVNPPIVKHQQGKITKALIHPIAATI